VTTIRKAGATQPIMLAGLDYANDLRGWLANRPSDTQLIASWHNYPGQRCRSVSCWNSEIAPVAEVVPVIASEFGQTDGTTTHFAAFLPWADAHGIGYAPWAWWVVDASESQSAALYALITDNTTFAPKAPAGTAYFAHLQALPRTAVTPVPPSRTGGTGAPVVDGPVSVRGPEVGTGGKRLPVAGASGNAAAGAAVPADAAPVMKVGLWREPVLKTLG
jgi:hypothetical protein